MKYVLPIVLCIAAIVGIVCACHLMTYSSNLTLPEKYVFVSSSSYAYDYPWERNTGAQYLGGDAYNYIVEASLKAGYYNAVSNEKTITYTGGMLLLFLSVFTFIFALCSIQKNKAEGDKIQILNRIARSAQPQPIYPHEDRPIAPPQAQAVTFHEEQKTEKEAPAGPDEQPKDPGLPPTPEENSIGETNSPAVEEKGWLDDKIRNQFLHAINHEQDNHLVSFLRLCSSGWNEEQKKALEPLFHMPQENIRSAMKSYIKKD